MLVCQATRSDFSNCRAKVENDGLVVTTAAHGIPWRRGYLFYGPPGSGKTSLVTALAGRLHKSIYVINLSSPAMNDEVRGPQCMPRHTMTRCRVWRRPCSQGFPSMIFRCCT